LVGIMKVDEHKIQRLGIRMGLPKNHLLIEKAAVLTRNSAS